MNLKVPSPIPDRFMKLGACSIALIQFCNTSHGRVLV